MVKVVVQRFGRVDVRDVEFVLKALEESYLRLQPHDVVYADLCLFESSVQMNGFFTHERQRLGITGGVLEDLFAAQHDAWRGTPRISVCLERLRTLTEEAQVGSLRHEVGHSILHGGIEYYMMPRSAYSLASRKGFSKESASTFLYLVSIAVKDFEVSRLLLRRGCLQDQVAYVNSIVCTSVDDRTAWQMSRGNRVAEALCIASRFKEICCAAPFVYSGRLGEDLGSRIVESLSYLGRDIAEKLLRIAKHDLPELSEDTMENIDSVSNLLLENFLAAE